MKIRTWRLASGAILIYGCSALSTQPPASQPAAARVVTYRCPGSKAFTAKFSSNPETVTILFDGSSDLIVLPIAPSGSGARYSDGKTTFWSKGDDALFESAETNVKGCKVTGTPETPPEVGAAAFLETFWKLTELDDQPAESPAGARQVYIQFTGGDTKRASGFSGCNRFNGTYTSDGSNLKFGHMASTMMACVGPNRESEFLEALKRTSSYRIMGNTLELMHDARVLARFEASQK